MERSTALRFITSDDESVHCAMSIKGRHGQAKSGANLYLRNSMTATDDAFCLPQFPHHLPARTCSDKSGHDLGRGARNSGELCQAGAFVIGS
jgi:hypothetical protein